MQLHFETQRKFLFLNSNQLDALNFYNTFISSLHMFRAHVLIVMRAKIVLYSIWYHHAYRCDVTRDCVIQFCPPDDEHMCSKHVEA